MAFRGLFAIATLYNLDIDQMDVTTAVLYGLIDQLVYVEILKGTESESVRLLPEPGLLVKSDGTYRATLWLCNPDLAAAYTTSLATY